MRHATLDHFKIDIEIDLKKNSDRGHSHFLNSTCDVGGTPVKGPDISIPV